MPDETDQRIIALALEHHLVTRLTSLVAVAVCYANLAPRSIPATAIPTSPSSARSTGDEIEVTRRDGGHFRFRVTGTSVVRWNASGIDPLADGRRWRSLPAGR
jgi:hypothetical protein